jgi:hypothetical protein
VGLRLRANCSLDRFLSPRIEEYTNYFVASDYDRKEVMKITDECSKVDRVELIKRPRKDKRRGGGPKKYVLCSRWDPRQPNVREGLKLMEDKLYLNKENEEVFQRDPLLLVSEGRKTWEKSLHLQTHREWLWCRWRGAVNLVQPLGLVHFMSQGLFRQ